MSADKVMAIEAWRDWLHHGTLADELVALSAEDLCNLALKGLEASARPEVEQITRYDIASYQDGSWEPWPSPTGEWVKYADLQPPPQSRQESEAK